MSPIPAVTSSMVTTLLASSSTKGMMSGTTPDPMAVNRSISVSKSAQSLARGSSYPQSVTNRGDAWPTFLGGMGGGVASARSGDRREPGPKIGRKDSEQ